MDNQDLKLSKHICLKKLHFRTKNWRWKILFKRFEKASILIDINHDELKMSVGILYSLQVPALLCHCPFDRLLGRSEDMMLGVSTTRYHITFSSHTKVLPKTQSAQTPNQKLCWAAYLASRYLSDTAKQHFCETLLCYCQHSCLHKGFYRLYQLHSTINCSQCVNSAFIWSSSDLTY